MDIGASKCEPLVSNESIQLKKRLAMYTRSRRLASQNGYYLEINDDGRVQGTEDKNSPFAVLQVLSIGENMLTIWGAKAEAYLAVDHDGNVYTTKTEGHQCVFMELFTKDFFNVYGSFKSVNEGRPKCLNILGDGSSGMKEFFGIPTNTCQFFWDMPSISVTQRPFRVDKNQMSRSTRDEHQFSVTPCYNEKN